MHSKKIEVIVSYFNCDPTNGYTYRVFAILHYTGVRGLQCSKGDLCMLLPTIEPMPLNEFTLSRIRNNSIVSMKLYELTRSNIPSHDLESMKIKVMRNYRRFEVSPHCSQA